MVIKYPLGEISKAIHKAKEHLLDHDKVFVSISGGSDSDVMLDLLLRAKNDFIELEDVEFNFVFFDTGIEYEATKRHLDYLEEKYNIKIERIRAEIPVPLGCKKFGVPFLTKFASEMIERLQKVNFDSSKYDKDKELWQKYVDFCKANPEKVFTKSGNFRKLSFKTYEKMFEEIV